MQRLKFTFFTGILYLLFSANAYAQDGKIMGKVIDGNTAEPLIGAAILVENTQKGAVTDLDGNFAIEKLNPGEYTLQVQSMGYNKKSITGVKVSSEPTSVKIAMEETSTTLKEVVISAEMKKSSVNTIIVMQKNATSISNGISAETIKQTPDKNSGEVLKRVSGATIQDNKYAIIRGLNDRYNNAMINGSPLPSTEPDRKTFSFDLIPSNMLDNMIIIKAATPDIPGDFAGGVIQLNTKDVPDEAFHQLAASTGYNTLTTFKRMIDYKGGPSDWTSFDHSRQLPASFPNAQDFSRFTNDQLIEEAKIFPNDYNIAPHTASPNLGLQYSMGNSYKFGQKNNKLGLILSMNYGNNNKTTVADKNWFEEDGHQDFGYHDTSATNSVNLGALLNIGMKLGNNTKFSLKNSYSRNTDDQTMHREGFFYANGFQYNSYAYNYTSSSLYLSQFSAEHFLPKSKIKITCNLSFGHTVKDVPNYRNLAYSRHMSIDTEIYSLVITTMPTLQSAKFYSNLKENIYGGNYALSYPMEFLGENQTMKLGGFHQYRDRLFDSRVLGFAINNMLEFNDSLLILPYNEVFNQNNFGRNGFTIRDITNPTNKYTANSLLNAGFVMFDNKIMKRLRIVWGVRFESYHQRVETGLPGSSITNPTPLVIDTTYNDFLPSANLTYSLTPKSNLRFSGSRTVSRPEFRELIPLSFYDFSSFSTIQGNSSLVRTNITNVDFRYELYPDAGMTFSVALFYKLFKNPIEVDLDNQSPGTIAKTFTNAPAAETYGAEIEFRQSLKIIKPSLENVIVYGNASYVYSKVDFNADEAAYNMHRPMQGQSPYIVNAGIQYIIPKYELGFSALYNRFGSRIYLVGTTTHSNNSNFADVYEKGRSVFDFQVSKSIKKKFEIKLTAADVIHQHQLFFQDWNNNSRYDKGDDTLMFDYNMPSIYSFSLSYKF